MTSKKAGRRTFWLMMLCHLLLPWGMHSQTISYIQPDVAAPGVPVAVEFIGPGNTIGNFGIDGLHMNRPGDRIRVVTADPQDSLRIVLGPVFVSWQGRMISTYVFPLAHNHPDHHDWRNIDSTYVIPLCAIVDGRKSNPVDFHIVRPHPRAELQAGDVLGENGHGIRSPSGSFVFASLNVSGGTVRVSTEDTDSSREGNQGYLPVHLQVIGNMLGSGDAVLQVDASGPNGGPGGGGGGGQFCKGSGSGGNGGHGYTGGGAGGRDASGIPTMQNSRNESGTGTGPFIDENSGGANGVSGGTAPGYLNAGGGSGHPFGASGSGCVSTTTCTPGGYGGGSGRSSSGGNGAYARNAPAFGGLGGGKEHGNDHLQPLAGGSGGASGTPAQAGECGGYGGGGGGALQVSALSIAGIAFRADGTPGQPGMTSGGCGSGGGIILSSRMGTSISSVHTRGGNNDSLSAGRVRIDGPLLSIPGRTAGASYYRGPSIDSTRWISLSGFNVRGTGNGERIRLYIRSRSNPWTQIAQVLSYENGEWEIHLELQDRDQQHFLIAAQDVRNPVADLHRYDPHMVMSATSANILYREDAIPLLAVDTTLRFAPTSCAQYRDSSILVRNIADESATLFRPVFTDGSHFSVIEPQSWPLIIPVGSSAEVRIRYHSETAPWGVVHDTLLLPTDDLAVPGQAHAVSLSAKKRETALRSSPEELSLPAMQRCADTTVQLTVDLENIGEVELLITDVVASSHPSLVSISASGGFPQTLPPGTRRSLSVQVTLPFSQSHLLDTLHIVAEGLDCRIDRAIPVRLFAESARLLHVEELDFGIAVPAEFPLRRRLAVRNIGTVPVTLYALSMEGQACFAADTALPVLLPPGDEIHLPIRFLDPGQDGACVVACYLSASPSCAGATVLLRGERLTPNLELQLPDIQASPGQQVELPVIVRSAVQSMLQVQDTLQFRLRVDASLLYPLGESIGDVEGKERVLDITLPINSLSGTDTLSRLPFMALLGRDEQTEIFIEAAVVTSGRYSVTTEPGYFSLDDVCREGGTRLFDADGRLGITGNHPNPFNNTTVIRYSIIERGPHRLAILDRTGRLAAVLMNGNTEPGAYAVAFDAMALSSGLYYAVLTTPTTRKVHPMLLLK